MSMSPSPSSVRPSSDTNARYSLTDGPQWYRTRIRTFGPLLAPVIPLLIGALGYVVLRVSDASWSGAVGLFGSYLGAPALLAVGAPFGDRALYPVAVGASVLMWLVIGFVASRRATRHPVAVWGDFWRHYFWLLAGTWAGVVAALAIATARVGSGIVDW